VDSRADVHLAPDVLQSLLHVHPCFSLILGYEWGADELVDGVVGFEQGDFLGQTVTRGQPGWCNRPRIHAGYEAERQRERERNTVGERGGERRREEWVRGGEK